MNQRKKHREKLIKENRRLKIIIRTRKCSVARTRHARIQNIRTENHSIQNVIGIYRRQLEFKMFMKKMKYCQ